MARPPGGARPPAQQGATVAALSPLAGLRRRGLGGLEVTAQSVGTTAPAAATASVPALVAARAGAETMYAFLAAVVVVGLVACCIHGFTRRMAASGSLYSFVARGLGPLPALACGVGLALGYAALAMATLALSAGYALHLLPGAPGRLATGAVLVALGGVAAGVTTRGVALASRVVLALEAGAICAVVLVVAVLALHAPAAPAARPAGGGTSLGGWGAGVALAITAFIGFESAAALGPETRRPHRTVSHAMGRTVAGAALLYLGAGWVELAHSPGGAAGLAASSTPLPDLAAHLGAWVGRALDVAVAASSLACAAAAATALARLLFSMAREGLLPAGLGQTSRRFRTPHVAGLASWVGVTGLALAPVALGAGAGRTFVWLATIATFGYMLAYLLVCAALPPFLHRLGELTAAPLAAGVVAAAALAAVLVLDATPSAHSGRLLLGVAGAVVAAGTAALAVRARRRPAVRLGVYDEPIASDLLATPWRRVS